MKPCLCNRLYCVNTSSTKIIKYAFSGSLCHIREFKTADGSRYCLTTFNLADYTHLHFPHDEYKYLLSQLRILLSTQTVLPTVSNLDNALSIKQLPFNDDFKIKLRSECLNIGPVTAFGLVNTSPFDNVDNFACDPKLDICTCGMCPVFKRLVDSTDSAQREQVNVILH